MKKKNSTFTWQLLVSAAGSVATIGKSEKGENHRASFAKARRCENAFGRVGTHTYIGRATP